MLKSAVEAIVIMGGFGPETNIDHLIDNFHKSRSCVHLVLKWGVPVSRNLELKGHLFL